ncbi:MAG: primosomal protein N' [Coriobacteriales bacterium]|nr:primosomal protein N' [Coriobacteriales bacterium]
MSPDGEKTTSQAAADQSTTAVSPDGEKTTSQAVNADAASPVGLATVTSKLLFAQVIIDIPTRALDTPFDYLIPEELVSSVEVGCSVLVSFNNRPVLGYVASINSNPSTNLDPKKLKPIREVLSTSFFSSQQYQLATWIAREYMAPLSETIRLLTPPGSTPRIKKDAGGSWQLEHAGVGPVDDRWVRLSEAGAGYQPSAKAVRQRAILDALKAGELKVSELGLAVESAVVALKSLEKKGVVVVESRRRMRGVAPVLPASQDIRDLTQGQRDALTAINLALAELTDASHSLVVQPLKPAPLPILLDGITGSGKTEVYLQAIRRVLEQGGTVIVLVPEISLTPQTVARFRSRFGEQVAVLHSRLSAGERFDQWDQLRSGTARVAVGARSALFAPVKDLKLIIIDEEHEGSYKQGSAPRYVSRDVAIRLANISGALLVLGSATPSMESLAAVKRGQMLHLRLPERPNGLPLPPIKVVDLSAEFRSGNKSMFSDDLREALLQTVQRCEKAVLLLNRRGFASFLLCRDCGYVPMCEGCSTSLTFHEHPPRLVCHHCGARQAAPVTCPECHSPYLRQLGPGTQFAYDQLVSLLPTDTPIIRMDADSTRGRYGHEKRLEEFAAAKYGVLLGTQMIAKGLDFPEVTLVGVLIADTALKLPDFRAAERTYQLLEQVAGRAGRADKDGRVIVQTYWPEHLAIQAAAQHDRNLLLSEEETLRRKFAYPPYARLANVLLWGEDLTTVRQAIESLADLLRDNLPAETKLLGPSPCVISRRQRQHRWHMLIKAPLDSDLPRWLTEALGSMKPFAGVNQAIDIDPYDMM